MGIFAAFNSTVKPLLNRIIAAQDRWLVDPVTGAIVGVKNNNASGADARFIPVDLTADQIAAPTALMLADLDAVYRLNVAPYTRYISNGTNLVGQDPESFVGLPSILQTIASGIPGLTIPLNSYLDVWAPFTIQNAGGVTVNGTLTVRNRTA